MRVVKTNDGTFTIYRPDIDEHYHSVFGAITESLHIFIQSGFNSFPLKDEITVFEIGFGTGLNALLTCFSALQQNKKVHYYTIEKYPLSDTIINQLNYTGFLTTEPEAGEIFARIHNSPWEQPVNILPGFSLKKINADLNRYHPDFNYDLIYFDAFSPEKQPELWSRDVFNGLFGNLNENGMLLTYSVKGEVKRMMKDAGFIVQKLPGPPGKREILRGLKKICIEK